jgi:UDP-glucose 4-epimerase
MILVTGGAGDVGKELVLRLAERSEVLAFDIAPNPSKSSAQGKIRMQRGNVLNLSEILGAIKENSSETVIHLASMLTSDCEARPYEAVSVNMLGTATVLEACRLAGCVKRFVFASTSSVYGATGGRGIINENFPKEPMNIYGALKYGSELYCRNYGKKYGIEYVACRLRVIFGPGQRHDTGAMKILRVSDLLADIMNGRDSIFVGSPEDKLEVTHPKDAAKALALAAHVQPIGSDAYNIMTGSYTFAEIARAFQNAVPGSIIKFDPLNGKKPVSGGPSTNFGIYDISRSRKELGYEPEYTIEKIVSEIVEYKRLRKQVA